MKLRYDANQILQFSSTLLFSTDTHTNDLYISAKAPNRTQTKRRSREKKATIITVSQRCKSVRDVNIVYVFIDHVKKILTNERKKKVQFFFFCTKKIIEHVQNCWKSLETYDDDWTKGFFTEPDRYSVRRCVYDCFDRSNERRNRIMLLVYRVCAQNQCDN